MFTEVVREDPPTPPQNARSSVGPVYHVLPHLRCANNTDYPVNNLNLLFVSSGFMTAQ